MSRATCFLSLYAFVTCIRTCLPLKESMIYGFSYVILLEPNTDLFYGVY